MSPHHVVFVLLGFDIWHQFLLRGRERKAGMEQTFLALNPS